MKPETQLAEVRLPLAKFSFRKSLCKYIFRAVVAMKEKKAEFKPSFQDSSSSDKKNIRFTLKFPNVHQEKNMIIFKLLSFKMSKNLG